VLVEFIADLYPEAGLMPPNPVERAQARFFVEFIGCKLLPAFYAFVFKGTVGDPLKSALEVIQQRLPRNSIFFGGDKPNAADISAAPFLARIELQLKHDLGAFPEGEGLKLYQEVFKGEQFQVLRDYTHALMARESFKKTFDEVKILSYCTVPMDSSLAFLGVLVVQTQGAAGTYSSCQICFPSAISSRQHSTGYQSSQLIMLKILLNVIACLSILYLPGLKVIFCETRDVHCSRCYFSFDTGQTKKLPVGQCIRIAT
jgi:hypothetical protein